MNILVSLLAQAQDAAAAADPAAGGSLEVQNVWDFVVKGGLMMIPIGICSFIALTVVIERLSSLRHGRVMPPKFVAALS